MYVRSDAIEHKTFRNARRVHDGAAPPLFAADRAGSAPEYQCQAGPSGRRRRERELNAHNASIALRARAQSGLAIAVVSGGAQATFISAISISGQLIPTNKHPVRLNLRNTQVRLKIRPPEAPQAPTESRTGTDRSARRSAEAIGRR
eukprot:scaffold9409_cov116-Isochrysis_galbana.AAC.19